MQRVRELKSRLRDAPHGQGRRVVLLMGLSLNRDEAANALLKALEEPSPTTVFVLLAPQREQLLPTLVSRSFCLTLPGRTAGRGIRLWPPGKKLWPFFCATGRAFWTRFQPVEPWTRPWRAACSWPDKNP